MKYAVLLTSSVLLAAAVITLFIWWGRAKGNLERRLAPYLVSSSGGGPHRSLAYRQLLAYLAKLLSRYSPGGQALEARLRFAGSPLSVSAYRVEQLVWSAAGLAFGLILAVTLAATRGLGPLGGALLALLGGVAGYFGRAEALGTRLAKRRSRLIAQMPDVVELLTLAITAGASATAALETVVARTRCELTEQLQLALSRAQTGTPLPDALRLAGAATDAPPVVRFLETLALTIERGTPLAGVLRAQVEDTREAARAHLLEIGGKREIYMMVPVVFLLLPLTVLFALLPGLTLIRTGL